MKSIKPNVATAGMEDLPRDFSCVSVLGLRTVNGHATILDREGCRYRGRSFLRDASLPKGDMKGPPKILSLPSILGRYASTRYCPSSNLEITRR